MSKLQKGIVLALVHLALVMTLAGKLVADRARYPRVWVKTAPYDPDLPIRGRYVRLRLEVNADARFAPKKDEIVENGPTVLYWREANLEVRDGELVAVPNEVGQPSVASVEIIVINGEQRARLSGAVAYFIPEHVPDPSMRKPDEELWVEVTVPRKGPPRPIQLGVKKDGKIEPIRY
jgi:uncharacterized membrane-anchored protein